MPSYLSAGVSTMAVTNSLDVSFDRAIPTLGAMAIKFTVSALRSCQWTTGDKSFLLLVL